MTTPPTDPIAVKAAETAQKWQKRANELLTHEEKGIQEQMQRLLTHPMDKVIMTKLIDQSFRSHDPARVADQVNSILTSYGVPDFFSRVEKLLMQMFLDLGRHFPALAVPKMIKRMRRNSSRAIISGDGNFLHAHLAKRRQQGVRMNINHLGEAVLGEDEARGRVDTYVADMKNPDIEYISVKISTIYSQINSLAFDHTVGVLKERLSEIYAVGKENFFERPDGTRVAKFVNLDMEEYRDLEVTYAAFTQTLDQAPFRDYPAGIVLQAYLPDSFKIQQDLTAWARKRTAGRRQPRPPADRQGRQHGNGAGGSGPAQLAPGALRQQTRRGRQLQADGALRHAAGQHPLGPPGHRLPQPVRTGLRLPPGKRKRGRTTISTSRCLKAWPTTSAAPCVKPRGMCSSMRPWPPGTSSSTPSAT